MFFTQWHKRLEGLYNVGRKHRTENIIAINDGKRDDNTPVFLFVAHYDSKSQVLPIAVRAVAYGIAIVGLTALTTVMVINVAILVWFPDYITLVWLPDFIVWGIAGITVFLSVALTN